MTAQDARRFAERAHGDAPDRYGMPLLDHVRRVALAVPREAVTIAWLHEILECTSFGPDDLLAAGVSEHELAAVTLLTRAPGADADAYMAHIEGIADAPGEPGRLGRIVKRADLRDRLLQRRPTNSRGVARPPYQEALRRLTETPAGSPHRTPVQPGPRQI